MECEIVFFGMIGEKLNLRSDKINLRELVDQNDLALSVMTRYPVLKGMTFKIAVDGFITNTIQSEKIETIAILPPFAGG